MALSRVSFRLLLIICYIIVGTSYRIDHRPFEDRDERAVTEWRFRRNYLLSSPYFLPNYAGNYMANNDGNGNGNGAEIADGKYLSNHFFYDPLNK